MFCFLMESWLPDQGSNPYLLGWMAKFKPLDSQGSPYNFFFEIYLFIFGYTGSSLLRELSRVVASCDDWASHWRLW